MSKSLPDSEDIARSVRERLGPDATGEMVNSVVRRVVELLAGAEEPSEPPPIPEPETAPPLEEAETQRDLEKDNRVLVIACGRNRPGVLAAITRVLADHNCDVVDLGQTIVQEFFTLIFLVNASAGETGLSTLREALEAPGEELNIHISTFHDDDFRTPSA